MIGGAFSRGDEGAVLALAAQHAGAARSAVCSAYSVFQDPTAEGDPFVIQVSAALTIRSFSEATALNVWKAVRFDCTVHKGGNGFAAPLWPMFQDPLHWLDLKKRLLEDSQVDWSFWVDWYDELMHGKVRSNSEWEMLKEIVLIDNEDWEQGPAHINPMIAEIVERYATKTQSSGSITPQELLTAALFDFSYDSLENVMRAIPMPDDWKHLDDEEALKRFLGDAEEVEDSLKTLSRALEAEGGALQGAGGVRTYLDEICSELARAEDKGTLRVGKLLEYGRFVEAAARRDDIEREFGVLHEPLNSISKDLQELIRSHFANTLARFAVLRELRMEDAADPWDVLRDFRILVDRVRSGDEGQLPALVREDVAVLDDVLDGIDRLTRDIDGAASDEAKDSLKRERDFQMAKVGATVQTYKDQAVQVSGKAADAADTTLKAVKRFDGLSDLARRIWDGVTGGGA